MSEDDSINQLASFFIYSLFVYPVTNYIVSPQRNYPKWKAALYVVLFLATVATIHLVSFLLIVKRPSITISIHTDLRKC